MKNGTGLILIIGLAVVLLSFTRRVENQVDAQPVNTKGLMHATLAAG